MWVLKTLWKFLTECCRVVLTYPFQSYLRNKKESNLSQNTNKPALLTRSRPLKHLYLPLTINSSLKTKLKPCLWQAPASSALCSLRIVGCILQRSDHKLRRTNRTGDSWRRNNIASDQKVAAESRPSSVRFKRTDKWISQSNLSVKKRCLKYHHRIHWTSNRSSCSSWENGVANYWKPTWSRPPWSSRLGLRRCWLNFE